ncbi:MAG: twin-arginine translocase subunit TatB, partial [Candidatus Competibacteraceae bacterium]|nr:twin-arginine translocase subunit TatB [Candidatus Competibacteraceae bacterium]
MFDMGFWEVVLIFVILLIVVGPERLPKLARTVGLWVGKARTMVSSVRSEIEQELRVEELKQSLHKQVDTEDFKALSSEVKSLSSDVKS